jgi:ABC-type glutathione transport system ATPase component
MTNASAPLLSLDLSVDYPNKPSVLRQACIDVLPGEIVGLVGQSGSGKSTLAMAILRLLDHTGARVRGRAVLLGADLGGCQERQMRSIRGRLVSLIPQSPAAALNPALRIETQLKEAWRAHSRESWAQQRPRILQLLESVGLLREETLLKRFPDEISVGQAQRVLIAMALLHAPPLLIADEPTSALDLVTQHEVLELLSGTIRKRRMSMLFISHDLTAVAAISDRIAILHAGAIVECGSVKQVLGGPKHPYTRQLIAAMPKWDMHPADVRTRTGTGAYIVAR